MDWVKAFGLLVLLSIAYPNSIKAEEEKKPSIDPPYDAAAAEAARKVELSKEGIMFGNQQNKPAAVDPPPDDDSTDSDGGAEDNAVVKPDLMEGKVAQGDDDKDYQYDEPYALYRKKRGLENEEEKRGMAEDVAENGNKIIRQRRRLYHVKTDREKRSASNFFDEPEGENGHHFLSAEQ